MYIYVHTYIKDQLNKEYTFEIEEKQFFIRIHYLSSLGRPQSH